MSDFGQCFRAVLSEKNLNQVEAAAQLGFAQSQISRLCNQTHAPRPHVLQHIAAKLGVRPEELIGRPVPPTDAVREAYAADSGFGKSNMVILRETPVKYGEAIEAPAPDFLLKIRGEWRKKTNEERAVAASAIKGLFPRHADALVKWLDSL